MAWTFRVYLESLVGLVLNCSKHKQKDPFKKPAGPRCKAKVRTCYYCCCCVCVLVLVLVLVLALVLVLVLPRATLTATSGSNGPAPDPKSQYCKSCSTFR